MVGSASSDDSQTFVHGARESIQIGFDIAHIMRGGFADIAGFHFSEGPFDPRGRAQHQTARRNFGSRRHHGTGGDDGVFSHLRAVHQHGAHADQATVADGAGVQRHVMADGDLVADHQRVGAAGDVQDASVLDVRPLADADVIDVSANHRVEPDTAFLADDDIADDLGALGDPGGGMNLRYGVFEGMNHGPWLPLSLYGFAEASGEPGCGLPKPAFNCFWAGNPLIF